MNTFKRISLAILICSLPLLHAVPASAGESCGLCGRYFRIWHICEPCEDGSDNMIEGGTVAQEINDNEDSFNQYGEYPDSWYTSGRLSSSRRPWDRDRLEFRWQDVSADDGRIWQRTTIWPLTIESDSVVISGRAWDSFGSEPALVMQKTAMDDLRLRFHRHDLENVQLRYKRFEVNRSGTNPFGNLTVQHLGTNANFRIEDWNTRGQVRQLATTFEGARASGSGSIDSTQVKLDTEFSDDLSGYGRLSYSEYDYDALPDNSFAGAEISMGLNYNPRPCWLLNMEYRSRENPADNAVSSHVQGFNEYGMSLGYFGSGGNRVQAGYRLRQVDYAGLNMQDATVFSLLRGSSVLRPADVSHAVTLYQPEFDVYWLDLRQELGEQLIFSTRIDLNQGSTPGTNLSALNSPSLLFDKQLSSSHGLSYLIDDRNTLDFSIHGQENRNGGRDSSTEMSYAEAVWSHRLDCCSNLALAWRDTRSSLDSPGFDGSLYATDDRSITASFGQELSKQNYTLNFGWSEGSGAEDYTQTSAGASIRFKELGPLGLRLDWYRREFTTHPALDSDALTVGVDYQIKF